MHYALDTHAVVWYLTKDPKLGAAARQLMSDTSNSLLLPTMVMAEAAYLGVRLKDTGKLAQAIAELRAMPNVAVIPFGEDALEFLNPALSIHDAIIIASALGYSARSGEGVAVVTKDSRIRDSGLVETVW